MLSWPFRPKHLREEGARVTVDRIKPVSSKMAPNSQNAGIDEKPKSEIEKRKRNMESISPNSRREKRNVEICFLVQEENENFCQKNGEILNIFSSFEMRREIQKYFL